MTFVGLIVFVYIANVLCGIFFNWLQPAVGTPPFCIFHSAFIQMKKIEIVCIVCVQYSDSKLSRDERQRQFGYQFCRNGNKSRFFSYQKYLQTKSIDVNGINTYSFIHSNPYPHHIVVQCAFLQSDYNRIMKCIPIYRFHILSGLGFSPLQRLFSLCGFYFSQKNSLIEVFPFGQCLQKWW